jgi:hypothetical protein
MERKRLIAVELIAELLQGGCDCVNKPMLIEKIEQDPSYPSSGQGDGRP